MSGPEHSHWLSKIYFPRHWLHCKPAAVWDCTSANVVNIRHWQGSYALQFPTRMRNNTYLGRLGLGDFFFFPFLAIPGTRELADDLGVSFTATQVRVHCNVEGFTLCNDKAWLI